MGKYENDYPQGCVVHTTGGQLGAIEEIQNASINGYVYFVIGHGGIVHQNFTLDSWGHHAGLSSWADLGDNLSKKLVGIELCNPGKVEPQPDGTFKSWFGKCYSQSEVRYAPPGQYINPGFYVKCTTEQEVALFELITWLHDNNPDVFKIQNVVGHDEVRAHIGKRGDKTDPGGSLLWTMEEFRQELAKD